MLFEEAINFDRIQQAQPTPTMLMRLDDPSAPRPAACAAAGHHIVSCSYPGATSVPEWRTGPIYPVAHPSPVTYRLDTRLVTFFTEGCYPPAVSKAAAKVASGPDLLASPVSIAAGSIVSLTGEPMLSWYRNFLRRAPFC